MSPTSKKVVFRNAKRLQHSDNLPQVCIFQKICFDHCLFCFPLSSSIILCYAQAPCARTMHLAHAQAKQLLQTNSPSCFSILLLVPFPFFPVSINPIIAPVNQNSFFMWKCPANDQPLFVAHIFFAPVTTLIDWPLIFWAPNALCTTHLKCLRTYQLWKIPHPFPTTFPTSLLDPS